MPRTGTPPDGYLNLKDAAEILGVSVGSVYRYIYFGRIEETRTDDGRLWALASSVEQLRERRAKPKGYIEIAAAAKLARVSPTVITDAGRRGEIHMTGAARRKYVRKSDVVAFASARSERAAMLDIEERIARSEGYAPLLEVAAKYHMRDANIRYAVAGGKVRSKLIGKRRWALVRDVLAHVEPYWRPEPGYRRSP